MNDTIVAHSEKMIRKGSKSFAAAAQLFDAPTRRRAYMLYAWCRHCDDQIDGQEYGFGSVEVGPAERLARLQGLRDSTQAAFADAPMRDPVFAAFQRVAREARLEPRHAMELLAGFEMDVGGARYRQLQDTLLYCYRVAGVVGVMMACIMGVRDRAVLARAADLGIAFQLTNIARDVLDDAAVGRCYLPEQWLEEAGVPLAGVAEPGHRERLFAVVSRLLAEADRYYSSARQGLAALPFRSAWAVATARGVYRDIGAIVLARGPAAWEQRAVVSRARKLRHALVGFIEAVQAVWFTRGRVSPPREHGLWMVGDLQPGD
jgi:phytoene synthase